MSAFPQLFRDHLEENPATPTIEQYGALLVERRFPEGEIAEFVRMVCQWGGYAGVGGRVLKNNALWRNYFRGQQNDTREPDQGVAARS